MYSDGQVSSEQSITNQPFFDGEKTEELVDAAVSASLGSAGEVLLFVRTCAFAINADGTVTADEAKNYYDTCEVL